ncbi:unnamed protein product [Chrysoparadoxa australica]
MRGSALLLATCLVLARALAFSPTLRPGLHLRRGRLGVSRPLEETEANFSKPVTAPPLPRPGTSLNFSGERHVMRRYLRPLKGRILIGMAYAILSSVAALGMPLGFSRIINVLLAPELVTAELTAAVSAVAGLYALEPMLTYLYVQQMTWVNETLIAALKRDTFKSIISQEVGYFDARPTGQITATVTSDIATLKSCIQMNLQKDRGIRALLESILGFVVLGTLAPQLIWIFVGVIPAVAVLLSESRKQLVQLASQESANAAKEASVITEVVRNIREVKSFGTDNRETSRFDNSVGATSDSSRSVGTTSGKLEALNRGAIYFTIVSVMWFGSKLVARGLMSPALLVSFTGYCFSLNFAIQGLNFTITDAKRGWGATQRVIQVLKAGEGRNEFDRQRDGMQGLDVIPPEDFTGRVVFNKVSFAYPTRPDVPVLRNINLVLPAGKVTALVGPSGAGKSTIASLLSRFYEPAAGEILVDGLNIQELDQKWLTQEIALVGQNPALFSGTIASNIAYGIGGRGKVDIDNLDQATMDKVVHAAKLANAHEFISGFAEGYLTSTGESGLQLSGGQRQRLAIARAIMKDARILVLDEATSSLDAFSEEAVQEALTRLMRGRTVLVIAHRLSTVLGANKIVVVNKGQVVEEGTHDELLAKAGAYSQLMRTQVNSYSVIKE